MPYGDGSKYKFTLTPISDIDITNPDTWEINLVLWANAYRTYAWSVFTVETNYFTWCNNFFNNVPAGV